MESVGVVGAGRVGTALAAALAAAGHSVVAASAGRSRERAAALLGHDRWAEPADVARDCELLLLTVPDDALPGVVARLAREVSPGQVVVHTSGRFGIEVLAPLGPVRPLALHPAMTFPGIDSDVDRLRGCPFGVTARPDDAALGCDLVRRMGGTPYLIAEDDRGLYHAALAHGSNHLVTLVAESLDLLRAAGIDDPGGFAGPLLRATLDNALRLGDGALTGPVSRGDAGTVAAHRAALREVSDEADQAYSCMARTTAMRALRRGGLSPEAFAGVIAAVDPEPVP